MSMTQPFAIEVIASEVHFSWADGLNVLKIGNSEEIRDVRLEGVDAVELHFPKFTDGRAYSQAVHLRRRRGFAGRIVATGDVLVDQIPLMRRCGFDAFVPEAGIDRAALDRALDRYDQVYQKAADGRVPVWAFRHG